MSPNYMFIYDFYLHVKNECPRRCTKSHPSHATLRRWFSPVGPLAKQHRASKRRASVKTQTTRGFSGASLGDLPSWRICPLGGFALSADLPGDVGARFTPVRMALQ